MRASSNNVLFTLGVVPIVLKYKAYIDHGSHMLRKVMLSSKNTLNTWSRVHRVISGLIQVRIWILIVDWVQIWIQTRPKRPYSESRTLLWYGSHIQVKSIRRETLYPRRKSYQKSSSLIPDHAVRAPESSCRPVRCYCRNFYDSKILWYDLTSDVRDDNFSYDFCLGHKISRLIFRLGDVRSMQVMLLSKHKSSIKKEISYLQCNLKIQPKKHASLLLVVRFQSKNIKSNGI